MRHNVGKAMPESVMKIGATRIGISRRVVSNLRKMFTNIGISSKSEKFQIMLAVASKLTGELFS